MYHMAPSQFRRFRNECTVQKNVVRFVVRNVARHLNSNLAAMEAAHKLALRVVDSKPRNGPSLGEESTSVPLGPQESGGGRAPPRA